YTATTSGGSGKQSTSMNKISRGSAALRPAMNRERRMFGWYPFGFGGWLQRRRQVSRQHRNPKCPFQAVRIHQAEQKRAMRRIKRDRQEGRAWALNQTFACDERKRDPVHIET